MRKTLNSFFSILLVLTLFITLRFSVPIVLRRFGVVKDTIPISGTGSMYPTFPKGTAITDKERSGEVVAEVPMRVYPSGITWRNITLFTYNISHGDIISFENDATRKISAEKYGDDNGFVKRVVGLPGDRIEIREGFVWRNGKLLEESYTVRPRSTFGGTFLPDCQELVVPPDMVFVLGDNRIASNDSRHDIGLVALTDIDHVLPTFEQKPYQDRWRDATNDISHQNDATLDTNAFISLLNAKRQENKVASLRFNQLLASSAYNRGIKMLSTNDVSFEATRSGYTPQRAIADSGYRNGLIGESSQLGYLSAEELLEASFEFPESRDFLLNSEYDDIGIAVVSGSLNNCPAQIVVQHFGGYVPPNYSTDEIQSWESALGSINQVIPSWEEAKSFEPFYKDHKDDLDRLLTLLYQRRTTAELIISRMKKNEWLTPEEEKKVSEDEQVAREANEISERLNK